MGLFKWNLNFKLNSCKDTIATGYVIAKSEEEAISKVEKFYKGKFHKVKFDKYFAVEIENDYDFFSNDNIVENCHAKYEDLVIKLEAEVDFC